MKSALVIALLLSALAISATSNFKHNPRPLVPLVGGSVPREQFEAMAKKAARRLKGWRKSNRLVVRLRGSLRGQVKLGASGLERGFLCIHRGEGAWGSATGNGYYGGLQMDRSFMASYGGTFLRSFGPASNWTPSMQLAVAETAYLSGRGFFPWPTTARACGLIG